MVYLPNRLRARTRSIEHFVRIKHMLGMCCIFILVAFLYAINVCIG